MRPLRERAPVSRLRVHERRKHRLLIGEHDLIGKASFPRLFP